MLGFLHEERRGEEKKKRKKKKEKRILGMDFLTFVWILVCSISRVYLGIHPNHRFVECWVGKTLVCIR